MRLNQCPMRHNEQHGCCCCCCSRHLGLPLRLLSVSVGWRRERLDSGAVNKTPNDIRSASMMIMMMEEP